MPHFFFPPFLRRSNSNFFLGKEETVHFKRQTKSHEKNSLEIPPSFIFLKRGLFSPVALYAKVKKTPPPTGVFSQKERVNSFFWKNKKTLSIFFGRKLISKAKGNKRKEERA